MLEWRTGFAVGFISFSMCLDSWNKQNGHVTNTFRLTETQSFGNNSDVVLLSLNLVGCVFSVPEG